MFIPEMWQHTPVLLVLMFVVSLVAGWKVSR